MSYELSGKLIEKFPIEQPSASFRKREFVVELSEERNGRVFTDPVKFQLTQDRVELIEAVPLQEMVKVSFDIKGNRWERDGRVSYFTNLVAWKVEKVGSGKASGSGDFDPGMPTLDQAPPDGYDDLPF
jgi:hypothetical protein